MPETDAEPLPPTTKSMETKASELIANVMVSNMLTAAEEQKLALTLNIKALNEELTQQKADQADVYYYLNKKCDDSFEVISSLEEQLLTEQADREVAEKLYENRVEALTHQLDEQGQEMGAKIGKLEKELTGLQAFAAKKGAMEKEIASLKRSLEKERASCKSAIAEMEQQWTLERNRLKRASDQALQDLKDEIDKGLSGRLDKISRETMERNGHVEQELRVQSHQADKVLEYNQAVLDKEKELRLNLSLSQSMEAELMEKMTVYQRTIKTQNEAIARLEGEAAGYVQAAEEAREALAAHLRAKEAEASKFDELWSFLLEQYGLIGVSAPAEGGKQDGESGERDQSSPSREQREEAFLQMLRDVLIKFPELCGLLGAGGKGVKKTSLVQKAWTQQSGSASISLLPAVSPPGKANQRGAKGRKADKRFSFATSIATQTDESSLGNVLHEESLWLTDAKHQAAGPSFSQFSVGQNESVASYNSGAGVAAGGSSSSIDHLSVKSASAVPPPRNSSKKGRGPGLSLGRTRMQAMAAASEVVSVSSGTSKSSKSIPLDMRYINDKQNSRPPRANESSFIPGITGRKKPITASDSPQASPKAIRHRDKGLGFDAVGGISPQSSVSMSPRGIGGENEGGSTIFYVSPRFDDEALEEEM